MSLGSTRLGSGRHRRGRDPAAAPQRDAAGELLGVVAIAPDGLAVMHDGSLLRALEVGAVNPLVMDPERAERVSRSFTQLASRITEGQSLQLHVQAAPLPLAQVVAHDRARCNQAAQAAAGRGEDARAVAVQRLGVAQEHSLRTHAPVMAAATVRYLVLCPWKPKKTAALPWKRPAGDGLRVARRDWDRAVRECDRHTDGIRTDLEAMDLRARPLHGWELADLLWTRFAPDQADAGAPPPSVRCPEIIQAVDDARTVAQARERATRLQTELAPEPFDFTDRTTVRVGESVGQTAYLSSVPDQTWLGWLLHLMQVPKPFALSVHIHATDRYRERQRHKRRYKRLYGLNRGTEMRGKPIDPEAVDQEQEAAELNHELAMSAGSGIYELAVYLNVREPGGDAEELREHLQALVRETMTATDARLALGMFAQRDLWRSSLPLGVDAARRVRKYVTRNVGDTFPLVGTSCGSPDGIPLGYAHPGRTLERLDPFDPAHDNHLMVVNGKSGSGKTMATNVVLSRCLAQGATGYVIDRAGHYFFLCSLIPGARAVRVGSRDGEHAINPWDVPDPSRADGEKIDYLLALHSLLIGQHHAGDDTYGLSALESNLLGLAIRAVYDRCALTGEAPREVLLQEELYRRAHEERNGGSAEISAVLRTLAERLHNYVGDGTYAYLTDRETTIPRGAPLVAFDTREIPDALAGAALFVICEAVTRRVEADRETHLTGTATQGPWAGRSFLVIDEAWKLIERPATGRWVNELARRSRHLALFMVAISQQLSDFQGEHGKALLRNSTMQLFLRQSPEELAYVKDALSLADEEIHAIGSLTTAKRKYSTAFLCNGTRGRGTISIQVSDLEYWIATSDPDRDEPIRRAALRDAGGDPWCALALLADPVWHHEQAEA